MGRKRGIKLEDLTSRFQHSADVQFQKYSFDGNLVHFVTCDAMIDQQLMNEVIVPRVQELFQQPDGGAEEGKIVDKLHIPELKKLESLQEASTLV